MTYDNMNPATEGRRNGNACAENTSSQNLLAKLDRLLAKAKPSKRELTQQHFRDLFPGLEAHLSKGAQLKDVLAAFNELAQAKVCARTFKEMLDQERACREQAGNSLCCGSCGRPLHSTLINDTPKSNAADSLHSS